MRILLDENTPIALADLLLGHGVDHVDTLNMKSLVNGELVAFARDHYDLLVTLDRGILHQHNHRPHKLRNLVIRVPNARLETVLARTEAVVSAISSMPPEFRGEI